ncbi:recombinase family protein [Metabacillus endolithicus]|uniref:Recombinase family protein n=1 Tax=Metabacillus endolithicus TaxID=1535204 RepID=A0ABW5C110_9BACI
MKRAYSYVRISTGKQENNTSIENQRKVIKDFCAAQGYELVTTYSETASAKSINGRSQFIKMINDLISSKDVDYLIVLKIDRAFRKLLDSLYIWDKLQEHNKYFISILDNVNTIYPYSKDTFIFSAYQAEKEREYNLVKTYSGMKIKASKGLFNGGKVLGYESVNGNLRVIPNEVALVRYIFKKYVYDNWGYKKIASELNLQGIKTTRNKEWTTNTIKTILENDIYIGYIKWKDTYTEGQHKKIIPQKLWDKAQEIKSKKSIQPKKIHPGTYPLSGLLKCPQCGSPMVQGNSSQKYKYYQCNKNKMSGKSVCSSNLVKKEYAEEYVLDKVVSYLNTLNLSALLKQIILSNLNSTLVSLEEEATILKNSLKQAEKKLSDLLTSFYKQDEETDDEEKLSTETFKAIVFETDYLKRKDQQKLTELNNRIEIQKKIDINSDIEFLINDFKHFYHIISDQDKKLLFHNFIKEIHVLKGNSVKERKIKEIIFHFDNNDINSIFPI